MSTQISKLSALLSLAAVLSLAVPGCGTKIAECNKFIDEANKGQGAFTKLDMQKEDSLKTTLADVEASNKRLAEMKFDDAKLTELQGNYVKTLKSVIEKMGKADDVLKGMQEAKDKSDQASLDAKKADFDKLTPEVDQAVKDSSKAIDDLNTYCTGSK